MIIDSDKNIKTELFIKSYRSFLQTSGEMSVNQFERLYKNSTPALHQKVNGDEIDVHAFTYAYLRFPAIMHKIDRIILAQTDEIFYKNGFKINDWIKLSTPARRRKIYTDNDRLAIIINSVSDVDDIVTILCALQIEWNKINVLLSGVDINDDNSNLIRETLKISLENWKHLNAISNQNILVLLKEIKDKRLDLKITQLQGSYIDYTRAMHRWYENILVNTRLKDLNNKEIYFVSSNNHSIVNTITGYVNTIQDKLITYIKTNKMDKYISYWEQISNSSLPGSSENFLWYILKKYEKEFPETKKNRLAFTKDLGIEYIPATDFLDINTQIIPVKSLINSALTDKLNLNREKISNSTAVIINIDYPLGFGAYMVLTTLLQRINNIKGVYILGKAAFLNGSLGDIALPATVYDSLTRNLFIFKNAFDQSYFSEFKTGNILSNQKALSVKGTLLNPESVIEEYFKKGFTVVEMENGSYLNAIFETSTYDVFPEMETVNLVNSPVDIGIIHYASDAPYTQVVTLGTRNLGYDGVEATYTSSLAILKRILEQI